MLTLTASVPYDAPPAWAVLERTLFDLMDRSVHPFLEKYTRPDGTLIWTDKWKNSRDGPMIFTKAPTTGPSTTYWAAEIICLRWGSASGTPSPDN